MSLINGHYDAAGALINAGADVNLSDKLGQNTLYSAVDDHTCRFLPGLHPRKSTKSQRVPMSLSCCWPRAPK